MDTLSPSIRDLARRLLGTSETGVDPGVPDEALVNEQLRIALTQFAGPDGFASLLRRALALASTEVPALRSGKVSAAGHLEGLEQLAAQEPGARKEAAVAVTAHMLGLLFTFIGEPLTLRLVRQAWPKTSTDEQDPERG